MVLEQLADNLSFGVLEGLLPVPSDAPRVPKGFCEGLRSLSLLPGPAASAGWRGPARHLESGVRGRPPSPAAPIEILPLPENPWLRAQPY